jgi:hypothetical protein
MSDFEPVDDVPDDEAAKELQAYYEACKQEWDLRTNGRNTADMTPTEIRENTKDLLTKAVPDAVTTLTYLAKHANAESVRLKAATTIIERAIGKDNAMVGDPFEEFVKGLQKD